MTTLGDENVRGFNVAVNDAFGMCRIESIGNFDGERENRVRVQRTIADAMLQRHAVQKLHDNEGLTILLINLMDRADVWVIESRSRLRFALEPSQSLTIFGDIVRQELDSHEAL